jgi:hypothetical protein
MDSVYMVILVSTQVVCLLRNYTLQFRKYILNDMPESRFNPYQ